MKKTLLGGILVLAFFLRVVGIPFGLPHLYHADEPIVVNHALAYGMGDLNPHFFKIPPLVSYLLFICYSFSFLIGRGIGLFKGMGEFEALFLKDTSFFYLLARFLFGALAGTASVFFIHRLTQRHFSRERGLVTAFFFAGAFLHVRDSHYIYADIPLLLVLVGAFFSILEIAEGIGGWRGHLWSGVFVGLAAATKYNGVMLTIPYGLASLLSPHKRKWMKYGAGAGVVALLTYSCVNPFTWLDFHFFWKEISRQAEATGRIGPGHHLSYSLNGGIGPLLLALGILGIVLGFLRPERKRLVLISFLVSYYFLLAFRSQPYDRYALPLVPFLLFFAADFIFKATQSLPSLSRGRIVFFLALLAACPTLLKSLLSDFIFLQKDVRTQALEWVEASIPSESRIALDRKFFMPRLAFSKEQLEEKLRIAQADPFFSQGQLRRIEFLRQDTRPQKRFHLYFLSKEGEKDEKGFLFERPTLPFDVRELKREKIDYVFIARVQKEYTPSEFCQELKREAKLVKRFSPYRDHREYPIDREPLTGGPFLWKELVARERNGQPIEVYRLR